MGSFKTPPSPPGEYDPVSGERWDVEAASRLWRQSMDRSLRTDGPRWTLQGLPETNGGTGFYWRYWNFRSWYGRVTVQADGFHWSTHDHYDGIELLSGVTTSLYVAYQSVVQNKLVDPPVREEASLWRASDSTRPRSA